MRNPRWESEALRAHWPLILVLCGQAALQLLACTMDIARLLEHLTVDDTFLYLQVARNVAFGRGPTFDGIHLTNGFQPLWLLATVPLGVFFRDPIGFLRSSLLLCAFLNLGTTCLLYRVGLRLRGRQAAVSLVVGWSWLLVRWKPVLSAMETSLYLLVFAWFLNELLRERPSKVRLSAVGGLVLLCRIDAVLHVAGGLLAARPRGWKDAVASVVPALLLAAPYLAWNSANFGSPLPISGRAKALYNRQEMGSTYAGWPHLRQALSVYLPRTLSSTASRLTAPLERVVSRKRRPRIVGAATWVSLAALLSLLVATGKARRLAAPAAFALGHMVVLAISLGRFAPMAWYYAPQLVLALLGASIALSRVRQALPGWTVPVGGVMVCGAWVLCLWTGAASLAVIPDEQDLFQRRYRLAGWMAAYLPSDAVIGSWNAGQYAFFSGLPVVNLDGLVNDQHYLERLRNRRPVLEYLEEEGIRFVVDYDAPDLSMPKGATWDHRRWFRGQIPVQRLRLHHQIPLSGRNPRTVKLLRVVPG